MRVLQLTVVLVNPPADVVAATQPLAFGAKKPAEPWIWCHLSATRRWGVSDVEGVETWIQQLFVTKPRWRL